MDTIQIDENIVIHKLAKHFYNGSYKFHLDANEVQTLSWSVQEQLLNLTINNILIKKYPISAEFVRLYLKTILNYLEPHHEVHEGIYDYMCSIMANKQNKNDFCYRHYVIDNNLKNIVTMKETKNMVINGTTGMKTWEAALILADWIISHKDLFKNKKVLELGSGVGFTGICVAKLCEISSISLTDCHDDVINTINDNIQINFADANKICGNNSIIYEYDDKRIGVTKLDWNFVEDIKSIESPDIVIGADIVYDPSILKPLSNVLKILFEKNKHMEVYIACIIRNEDTLKEFFTVLESQNMSIEKLTVRGNVHIEWDSSVNRCFIKINYKV
ncbi:unnamed protein product [Colias eurytheme]|nr:unnamed protein product [Colias eurytheme]